MNDSPCILQFFTEGPAAIVDSQRNVTLTHETQLNQKAPRANQHKITQEYAVLAAIKLLHINIDLQFYFGQNMPFKIFTNDSKKENKVKH